MHSHRSVPLLAIIALLGCQTTGAPHEDDAFFGAGGKADGVDGVEMVAMLGAEPVTGELAGSSARLGYIFWAEAATAVDLEVTRAGSSSGLDTLLRVYGPRGADGTYAAELASDDEAGYGQLSRIRGLTLEQEGFYLVELAVDPDGGDAAGKSFRLELGCPGTSCVAPGPVVPIANDVHWVRNSIEQVASVAQAYAMATAGIERMEANGELAGDWAVVLDTDETLLDNSLYQKERAELGVGYSSASWGNWVSRHEATALPGAVAFLTRVHALGGTIAIVTNRKAAECADTEVNLQGEGVPYDLILCRTASSNKQARWNMVEEGTASGAHAAARIVMWVGDNAHDFPGIEQEARYEGATAVADFGRRFIQIPNPMYGSWTSNPRD